MTRRRWSNNIKGERTKPRGAREGSAGNGEAGEGAGDGAGRFSYQGLDRVMHEKARLGIMSSLAANASGGANAAGGGGGLLFNDLKQLCSLTDGNLSRHLAVLIDAGLVEARECAGARAGGAGGSGAAGGGRQQTIYRLTSNGRRRFAEYINVLEKVVADAQADARPDARKSRMSGDAGLWSPA